MVSGRGAGGPRRGRGPRRLARPLRATRGDLSIAPWWLISLALLAGCNPPGDDDAAAGDDDDHAWDDDDVEDDDSSAGDDDSSHGDDDSEPPAPPELTIACEDSAADVYITPEGMPPWDASVLGDVVRCSAGTVLTAQEVGVWLDDAGVAGVEPVAGVRMFTVAYRTTRWDGEEGVGTARIVLPDTLSPEGPLPIVVATHGTAGLADICAPSLYETGTAELTLPFASQGFAVVAPDYAGLGNEGTQGYADSADTAHSVLDAARALRSVVTEGSLAPGVIVAGHSQGGGAALAAHAYAPTYGDDDLLGAIAFAPGWTFDTEEIWQAFRYPEWLLFSGATAVIVSLMFYADAANHQGPGQETLYFAEDVREPMAEIIESQCVLQQLFTIPPLGWTFASVIDEDFIDTVVACVDGTAGCGPPGDGYVQRTEAGVVSVDAGGGPILFLQGLDDDLATPERAACIVDRLIEDGITPQVCTYEGLGHFDVVESTVALAVQWAEALATGGALPACEASDLPACE